MNKWYKTADKLPGQRDQVLIQKEGKIQLAIFEREQGKFSLIDGESVDMAEEITWMEVVRSPDGLIYRSYLT